MVTTQLTVPIDLNVLFLTRHICVILETTHFVLSLIFIWTQNQHKMTNNVLNRVTQKSVKNV